MSIPELRVVGYWPAKTSRARGRDVTHLDKALFRLPAADVLIEYEYRGSAKVEVRIDNSVIDTIAPVRGGWQQRVLVVRDILGGVERRLIFDNTEYPSVAGKEKFTPWAVRNVRMRVLTRSEANSGTEVLNQTIAFTDRLNKSPEALYQVLDTYYLALLELIGELKLDAVGFGVNLELPEPDSRLLKRELDRILQQRRDSDNSQMLVAHLRGDDELCKPTRS